MSTYLNPLNPAPRRMPKTLTLLAALALTFGCAGQPATNTAAAKSRPAPATEPAALGIWTTYSDTERHFQLEYPATWVLASGNRPVRPDVTSFLSLTNLGREYSWLSTGAEEKTEAVAGKLPQGGVYLEMRCSEYALQDSATFERDGVAAGLSVLLEKSPQQITEYRHVRFRHIGFWKWGRHWMIDTYVHELASEQDRAALDRVVRSIKFDGLPAGDQFWAAGLARKHLWPQADPRLFPLKGTWEGRSVDTESRGDEVLVTFTSTKDRTGVAEHTWQFRVTASGEVVPIPGETNIPLQTSPWGALHGGLQCRVTTCTEIEQGMPLMATVELQSVPGKADEGAKSLNTFCHDAFLRLSLKNVRTGAVLAVQPFDPTAGLPDWDEGKDSELLDGSPLAPWEVSFPLVEVRGALDPGQYECAVEYAFPREPTRWWRPGKEDWDRSGFWNGAITSGPFLLSVLDETPKTRRLLLPARLRYSAAERRVYYTRRDAVAVEVPVSNGFFMLAQILHERGMSLGRVLGPDDPNSIARCVDIPEGGELSYTIEVFETPEPPAHLRFPGHRKVLWEKTLTVSSSASPAAAVVPARDVLLDEMYCEDARPLWRELKAALPPSEDRFFGHRLLWLNDERTAAFCIFVKYQEEAVDPQASTNAWAAVFDKSPAGYTCRQSFELWSPSAPQLPSEPTLFGRRNKEYGRVDFFTLDLDKDGDTDIVVNLILLGGSYAGAETIALRNDDGLYSIVLSKSGAESQCFGGGDVNIEPIDRIADLDANAVPEIHIWHEILTVEPHSNARCWLDIYHWHAGAMVKCNSSFPARYDLVGRGFLEVCERYPDATGEFYYCLGLIAEYQEQPARAVEYYNKCLSCRGVRAEFLDAARQALDEEPVAARRFPGPLLKGLGNRLAIGAEAPTLAALLDRVKPDLVLGGTDMLWIENDDAGKLRFTLDRAFRFEPEGQPLKWVLLECLEAPPDTWFSQLGGEYLRCVVSVTNEIPQEDHWPSYAVAKSTDPQFGTVYEIGWHGLGGMGSAGDEGRLVLYVMRDRFGRWRFIGEGPGEANGRSGADYSYSYSVQSRVVWPDAPGSNLRIEFMVRNARYQPDSSDYDWPPDLVRRHYVVYTHAVLEADYPGRLRPTTASPYMLTEKAGTFDTLVEHLARWNFQWPTNRGDAREQLLKGWRAELLRLNPDLPKGDIPEGTRVIIGRVQLNADSPK